MSGSNGRKPQRRKTNGAAAEGAAVLAGAQEEPEPAARARADTDVSVSLWVTLVLAVAAVAVGFVAGGKGSGGQQPPQQPKAGVAGAGAGGVSYIVGGVWRGWGVENGASGKYEFDFAFATAYDNANAWQQLSLSDSVYPDSFCTPVQPFTATGDAVPHVAMYNCTGSNGAALPNQYCLVQALPPVGGLDAAFLACNHTGWPAPANMAEAMNSKGSGNYLLFRCPQPSANAANTCSFTALSKPVQPTLKARKHVRGQWTAAVDPIRGAPLQLLGSWRSLEVSADYNIGVTTWNFTADGSAVQVWPNYPQRPARHYVVSRVSSVNRTDNEVLLTDVQTGRIKVCLFEFIPNSVSPYAVLSCGPEGGPPPAKTASDGLNAPNEQYVMGRCNPCSPYCQYSCSAADNNCGHGPCPDSTSSGTSGTSSCSAGPSARERQKTHCRPGQSCWPTDAQIAALRHALEPDRPRNLNWRGAPQGQVSAMPVASLYSQCLYGLGQNCTDIEPLYVNDEYMYNKRGHSAATACFTGSNATEYNFASPFCKASVRNNPFNGWTPAFVAFCLTEEHARAALQFAVDHDLCVMVASTGHEYLNRHSCPTGGMMIRTTAMRDATFLPGTGIAAGGPTGTVDGALRFGPGHTWSSAHAFAAQNDRVISSGWCNSVGLVGWSLGGGHGPLAPALGLGVDNTVSFDVLHVNSVTENGHTTKRVVKSVVSATSKPHLFWAMKGGGGSTWGLVTSITIRAHTIPAGGFSMLNVTSHGTFCDTNSTSNSNSGGLHDHDFLKRLLPQFAQWQLSLNHKFSVQTAVWTTASQLPGDACGATWRFVMTYYYYGGPKEADQVRAQQDVVAILDPQTGDTNDLRVYADFHQAMDDAYYPNYVIRPTPQPQTNETNTGAQSSVLVSREMVVTHWADTFGEILSWCPARRICPYHFIYVSFTGNIGSAQPDNTAVSPGMRSGLLTHNSRGLSQEQLVATVYPLGKHSYFSESAFYMPQWTTRYWGDHYDMLLAVKKVVDPFGVFWCHHCIGDDANASN